MKISSIFTLDTAAPASSTGQPVALATTCLEPVSAAAREDLTPLAEQIHCIPLKAL